MAWRKAVARKENQPKSADFIVVILAWAVFIKPFCGMNHFLSKKNVVSLIEIMSKISWWSMHKSNCSPCIKPKRQTNWTQSHISSRLQRKYRWNCREKPQKPQKRFISVFKFDVNCYCFLKSLFWLWLLYASDILSCITEN